MEDFNNICPVCQTKGNTSFLVLRQINLTTAVYLCEDVKCLYPQGHSWIFVERDLFTIDDDQSDSDVSDSVNDDLEKMQNAIEEACTLKAKYITETINDNIVNVLKPNEQKLDKTEYQENNNTRKINSDGSFTNIVEISAETECNSGNEERNYNLHVDINTDLGIIEESAQHDVHSNSNLQDIQLITTEAMPFKNATHLSSVSKVENIIIDDPEGIFKIYSTNTTGTQLKILASGAQGTETVNLALSKSADVKCNFGRNDNNPNNIKQDIQLNTQKQDNIIVIEDNDDINGLKTPKINNLNNVPKKQKKTVRSFNKISDILNIKESDINIDNTLSEAQFKNMDKLIERRKIENTKKLKKNTRRQKPKTPTDRLKLPTVMDIDNDFSFRLMNTNIGNQLKTKLKVSAEKVKQQFCFSDSILQEAGEITKEDANKIYPTKNRSVFNLITGKNKRKTNTASCFEGFKYSSEIIKAALPATDKKAEQPIKDQHVHFTEQLVENKCQEKLINTHLEQKQSTIAPTNICLSGESATSDNILFGDEALNALFFDNIDEHHVKAPNDNVNIEEIDEILASLVNDKF